MDRRTINRRIVAVGLALFFVAARLEAGSVTVAWDPNPEANIAGYTVYWGTQSGVYTSSRAVTGATSLTVTNLTDGRTYYFVVQAYNTAGLRSDYSLEVSAYIGANPLSVQAWMQKFGVTDMNADDDRDGVTNQQEYDGQTDPTLPNTWYLTEGSTTLFSERLAILNPGTDPAEISVTFLPESGTPVYRDYSVPAQSRMTVDVQTIPGVSSVSHSAMVTSRRGGVVVERTMFWSATGGAPTSGHTGKGVSTPRSRWYFAEGDAGVFDTYLLFANPNSSAATISITYLLDDGRTLSGSYTANPTSRLTVYTNDVPGLSGHSFSTAITASQPVTAERSMYLTASGQLWKVGTAVGGIEAPSSTWYVSEGATGPFFDEYLLIGNPNQSASTVTIRFLKPSGSPVVQTYTVPAQSRTTLYVDDIPGLEDTSVSASVTASMPVVVERAMYWPGNWATWYEGHASAAVAQAGTKWALAEGEVGGSSSFMSYILIANPSGQDANVRVTLLRANGAPPVVSTYTVAANSRLTLYQFPLTSGEKFGAMVESTNGIPVVAERSMYWNANGLYWSGGTNETGVRLR